MLKRIRIYISLLVLILFLAVFIEFDGINTNLSEILTHTQLIPLFIKGFLSGSVIAIVMFVVLLVFTFIFGRVYCSTLCPLGTVQDFFIFLRYKLYGKKRFFYRKNHRPFRYIFAEILFIFLLAGIPSFLNIFEPYSSFGRIAAGIFKPSVFLIFEILPRSYFVPEISAHVMTYSIFSFTLGFFVFIALLSFFKGRFYCNTLCPAGAVLGLVSKKQRAAYNFNEETCNGCGICSNVCKAECLDHKNKKVDTERCVGCFNCLNSCPKGSITYGFIEKAEDKEKRKTIKGVTGAVVAIGSYFSLIRPLRAAVEGTTLKKGPIIPPGAVTLDNFNSKCTACHLCVTACPQKVLSVSIYEYGLSGLMQPKMDFEESYCLYRCIICTQVCPTGAIKPLTKKEKIITKIGTSKIDKKKCIPYYSTDNCTVCSEHCPTKAVYSVYYKGRLAPVVKDDICIGCGACENVCPSKKGKAIVVKGLATHKKANDASKADRPGYWRNVDKSSGVERKKRNPKTEDFPF